MPDFTRGFSVGRKQGVEGVISRAEESREISKHFLPEALVPAQNRLLANGRTRNLQLGQLPASSAVAVHGNSISG